MKTLVIRGSDLFYISVSLSGREGEEKENGKKISAGKVKEDNKNYPLKQKKWIF